MKVSFSSSFRRAFKKRIKEKKELESRVWSKLEVFTNDSFDPSLRIHKLSGKLKDLWSFSVEYDELFFTFTDDGNTVLVDIGNHDEVY
ncbi:type II toxin-antitoxin system RelE/ParE family toxin [Myxosarcina sp. GI1(2024)]